jgi:hypothetical protein
MAQIQELYSEFSSTAQLEALLQMTVNLKRDSPEIRDDAIHKFSPVFFCLC